MFEPCRSVNSLCVLCDSALKSTCSTCSTRLKIDLRIVSNAFGEEKEMIK